MHLLFTCVLVVALAFTPLQAHGNTWNKLRYNGGTVPAKVDPFDWNSSMTITPDAVALQLGRRTNVKIATSDITRLTYGQKAHRRVADLVALSAVATPLVLFGLLHKSKTHLIGIEYKTSDGKPAAVFLEADKGDYRTLLQVLSTVSGKAVEGLP